MGNYFIHKVCLYFVTETCFVVISDEVRQDNLRMANLAAGVSVCILLAFVILFAVWVYIRYVQQLCIYEIYCSWFQESK